MAKKVVKKTAKKAALPPGIKAVKNKIAKHDAKRAVKAGKPTKGRAAKKAPNPQQKPKAVKLGPGTITVNDGPPMEVQGMTVTPEPKRKIGKSPALAAPYGKPGVQDNTLKGMSGLGDMTPAVHDFAKAFKNMIGPPPKRSAASLLGDEAPPQINGVTLRELVTTFIADNKRFGELTAYAKAAGFDAQAFAIVAVLHLPYMRETKAAVELYTKMLADG